MNLSTEQLQALDLGEGVPVTVQGKECVLLPKDVYDRVNRVVDYDGSQPSPDEVYETIQTVTAEDDPNDPALDSYQKHKDHCAAAIAEGIADMEAGRVRPLTEAVDEIRAKHGFEP